MTFNVVYNMNCITEKKSTLDMQNTIAITICIYCFSMKHGTVASYHGIFTLNQYIQILRYKLPFVMLTHLNLLLLADCMGKD